MKLNEKYNIQVVDGWYCLYETKQDPLRTIFIGKVKWFNQISKFLAENEVSMSVDMSEKIEEISNITKRTMKELLITIDRWAKTYE